MEATHEQNMQSAPENMQSSGLSPHELPDIAKELCISEQDMAVMAELKSNGSATEDSLQILYENLCAQMKLRIKYSSYQRGDAESLAEDVVSEAFYKVLAYHGDLTLVRPGYLFIAALHCLYDHYKRSETLRTITVEKPLSVKTPDFIEALAEQEIVERVLSRLPENYLSVIQAFHVEGMKISEIALLFGLSEPTIKMRLVRGREQFAKLYNLEAGTNRKLRGELKRDHSGKTDK